MTFAWMVASMLARPASAVDCGASGVAVTPQAASRPARKASSNELDLKADNVSPSGSGVGRVGLPAGAA